MFEKLSEQYDAVIHNAPGLILGSVDLADTADPVAVGVDCLSTLTGVKPEEISTRIAAREASGSTLISPTVAMPHLLIDAQGDNICLFIRQQNTPEQHPAPIKLYVFLCIYSKNEPGSMQPTQVVVRRLADEELLHHMCEANMTDFHAIIKGLDKSNDTVA